MTTEITNTDNTIDSLDVIKRIEELEGALLTLKGDWDGVSELDAPPEFLAWEKEYGAELDNLRNLAAQAEDSPDWEYGAQLIHESYFTTYIEELISECYELPEEVKSGGWPYRHITIDYEAAADEAKQDYTHVNFNGETYLIRS